MVTDQILWQGLRRFIPELVLTGVEKRYLNIMSQEELAEVAASIEPQCRDRRYLSAGAEAMAEPAPQPTPVPTVPCRRAVDPITPGPVQKPSIAVSHVAKWAI
eukprot:Blabericola_migrator_1__9778@NODE_5363_length_794_cov_3_508941_g3447_i0_p1_GENE_NODE_5363_length_794_cov_3_508941_g3447_i0NODE_5363_length_794_cov_3_508941_g3447_i0_p1_ORF_typecomplete_len103_score9_60_NODE_5363_length_794_cov_3_508941_g3447_i0345653